MSKKKEQKQWRLGEILVQNGWVSWEHLQKALDIQSEMNQSMGEVLSDRGIISKKQGSGLHLGEILVKNGWLNWKHLGEALEIQRETGRIIGQILVERGFVSERNLYRGLAIQAGVPFVDFENVTVAAEALALVPKRLAFEYRIMPLVKKQNVFLIATTNPRNFHYEKELQGILKSFDIRVSVACPEDMEKALVDYYGPEVDAYEKNNA